MTKLFSSTGLSQAFLSGALVTMGGRPGKVVKVDGKSFTVEFPEQWVGIGVDDAILHLDESSLVPDPEQPKRSKKQPEAAAG